MNKSIQCRGTKKGRKGRTSTSHPVTYFACSLQALSHEYRIELSEFQTRFVAFKGFAIMKKIFHSKASPVYPHTQCDPKMNAHRMFTHEVQNVISFYGVCSRRAFAAAAAADASYTKLLKLLCALLCIAELKLFMLLPRQR